jgi:isopentenyl-diphosphate Delta-isomerase
MADEIVLICDEQGRFRGEYLGRDEAHRGDGRRHLAITVLLYNRAGQVLLQQRKHPLFDGVWDFTGATHVLHRADGDETFEEATVRCLWREYGVRNVEPRVVGTLNYFARDGAGCENEHCAVVLARHDGPVRLSEEVGYACRWVDPADFLREIQVNPDTFSPWAVEGAKVLRHRGFFDQPPT